VSVLEPAIPFGICTCSHPPDCRHECHDHLCDPGEAVCSIEFRPDEGGLTDLGCDACTPGAAAPHLAECPVLVSITPDHGGRDGGDALRL
jgi:hypothetical protein